VTEPSDWNWLRPPHVGKVTMNAILLRVIAFLGMPPASSTGWPVRRHAATPNGAREGPTHGFDGTMGWDSPANRPQRTTPHLSHCAEGTCLCSLVQDHPVSLTSTAITLRILLKP
jgi:hypothetical protein